MSSETFAPWLEWLDTQQTMMLEQTIALASINSGTLHAEGVNRVADALIELASGLGGVVERLPVAPYVSVNTQGVKQESVLGDAVRITKRPDAPLQVFFAGTWIPYSLKTVRFRPLLGLTITPSTAPA